MGLDMLGLKKDMEAAMKGAEKNGEKHSLMNLKKMYGKSYILVDKILTTF